MSDSIYPVPEKVQTAGKNQAAVLFDAHGNPVEVMLINGSYALQVVDPSTKQALAAIHRVLGDILQVLQMATR